MQENFEVNNLERHHEIVDECIIAKKVYGKCKQKDCLTTFSPNICCNDGHFGKDSEAVPIQALALAAPATIPAVIATLVSNIPGDSIAFTQPVALTLVSTRLTSITTNLTETPFNEKGYWNVNITYNFEVTLTVTTSTGAFETLIATTTFSKTTYLFGGCVGEAPVYTFDSAAIPSFSISSEEPSAYVQAIVNPLAVNLVSIDVAGVIQYVPNVVIGLFTIIKLYRISNISVASTGPCELPECETITPGDPCKYFDTLEFPIDSFDPPSENDCYCD